MRLLSSLSRLVLVITVLATIGVMVFGSTSGQAATIGGPVDWGPNEGPSGFYDFSSGDCTGNHTDPVGVIFVGKRAGVTNVSKQIAFHTRFSTDEDGNEYPAWRDLPAWWEGAHSLFVRVPGGGLECRTSSVENASASPVADRFHIRLWNVPASEFPLKETVGTPHHEDFVYGDGCNKHAVDPNWSVGNQGKSGFDWGRHQLRYRFSEVPYGRHKVQSEYWGNSANFPQCGNSEENPKLAGSDGWGLVIWINISMEAEMDVASSTRATSSMLNGRISSEEPGEWWFAYGPSHAEGVNGYPNKTPVRSISGPANKDVHEAISSLSPNTAYYARMFARNQDGEVEEGNEIQYSTLPLSQTTVVAHPTNGTPGSVWASGMVTAGGNPVASNWLNVNFSKKEGGNWVLKETLHPTTASNGSYSTALLGVGVGKWRVKAVLPPSETVEGSESAYSEFEIKPGLCQTNSYLTPGVPFNGQPGYISVSGSVQVPNPECGIVNGQYVNVNFSKNEGGVYVYKGTAHATVYNGSYSVANWTVGTGNWRVKTVFQTQDWFKESESGEHFFSVVANGWHSSNVGGGTILDDPALSSSGPNKLDIFVRGLDGNLWQKWSLDGGTSWSAFQNLTAIVGGPIASAPSSVSWGSNRVDIVARMTNGTVGHWYHDGSWHFKSLGGDTILGDPEIASTGSGHLNVFARGLDGNLWQKWTVNGGVSWSGWQNLSAIVGGPIAAGAGAVSALPNSLTIVARRPDSTIGVWSYVNGGWSFQTLPGQILDDPDISSTGSGHVNVFAAGLDYNLWQMWTTGIGWNGWQQLSVLSLGSGPSAVSLWGSTRVDIVSRMVDGTIGHWWYG